jgi:hypothetical protein
MVLRGRFGDRIKYFSVMRPHGPSLGLKFWCEIDLERFIDAQPASPTLHCPLYPNTKAHHGSRRQTSKHSKSQSDWIELTS